MILWAFVGQACHNEEPCMLSAKRLRNKNDALPFMVLQPFGLRMLRCWQLYVDKNRQPDHRDY